MGLRRRLLSFGGHEGKAGSGDEGWGSIPGRQLSGQGEESDSWRVRERPDAESMEIRAGGPGSGLDIRVCLSPSMRPRPELCL